jgi:hypothetical protein
MTTIKAATREESKGYGMINSSLSRSIENVVEAVQELLWPV